MQWGRALICSWSSWAIRVGSLSTHPLHSVFQKNGPVHLWTQRQLKDRLRRVQKMVDWRTPPYGNCCQRLNWNYIVQHDEVGKLWENTGNQLREPATRWKPEILGFRRKRINKRNRPQQHLTCSDSVGREHSPPMIWKFPSEFKKSRIHCPANSQSEQEKLRYCKVSRCGQSPSTS